MYNDKKIKNKIIRRVLLLGSFKLVVFSIIIGRLYKLQVIDRQKYKTLANKNRIDLVLHAPTRGKVLDANGYIIADNRKIYTLTINPFLTKNIDLVINSLKILINISEEESKVKNHLFSNPNNFLFKFPLLKIHRTLSAFHNAVLLSEI